jgi:hypothetical protein
MRFSLKQDGRPLAWPPTDVDLATVVIIDMHRPLGPQALRAAIFPRWGMRIGTRSTLLAAALTAAALGLAAMSYLA